MIGKSCSTVMMTPWLRSISCVLLLLALTTASARADGPEADARHHFEQGVALYQDGDFKAALGEFDASYHMAPVPGVLYNIGLTEKALFRYAESIDTLRRYLAEAKNLDDPRRAEVDRMITEISALLANVTLSIRPPGAAVLIDGRSAGPAPLSMQRLSTGPHVIEVSAEGYRPLRKEVQVVAGVPLSLHLELPALPRTGTIHTLNVVLDAPQKSQKVYQKWWFWTVLGLAAGGVATAIAVPLAAGKIDPPLLGTLAPGATRAN